MLASRNGAPVYVLLILFFVVVCVVVATIQVGGW